MMKYTVIVFSLFIYSISAGICQVSNESASGITRISLDSGLPIANGVLTCDTDEQANVRVAIKGADCARAVIEMANLALALIPDLDIEINPNSSQ